MYLQNIAGGHHSNPTSLHYTPSSMYTTTIAIANHSNVDVVDNDDDDDDDAGIDHSII